MPDDDPYHAKNTNDAHSVPDHDAQASNAPRRSWHDLFSIPPPVKRVFDEFPLVTYEANELPARAPKRRREHVLHVFTTTEAARLNRPSFNPGCLRWQAYLRFNAISFTTVPSTNHASPSGSLPFLLPAVSSSDPYAEPQEPVASNKLKKWIASQTPKEDRVPAPEDVRYEAYTSLIDNRVRKAWLYQLYLNAANTPLLHSLYIRPCTSNPLVQLALTHQLRRAAEIELTKSLGSAPIVESDLMLDAAEAFAALSALLGDEQWFFSQSRPGFFDAMVFAYAQLSLDEGLGWQANGLGDVLRGHENLVGFVERVGRMYF